MSAPSLPDGAPSSPRPTATSGVAGTAGEEVRTVLVLVSAEWAGPSRPAPTVLRELSRRWGSRRATLLIEAPDGDMLDRLGVDVLPTWMLFGKQPATCVGHPDDEGAAALEIDDLRGTDAQCRHRVLEGPWGLLALRAGAQPKHVIEELFGPGSSAGD